MEASLLLALGEILRTGLNAGTGAPWAGQERAREEKTRRSRLAIVSEGNFGVDPPTGSGQRLMSYWPVSRDRSTLSWTGKGQRGRRHSCQIGNGRLGRELGS